MNVKVISLFLYLEAASCINLKKFQKTPPPQKNFDVDRYVGNWYNVARLPTCSWSGSQGFTNYVSQYVKQPNGVLNMMNVFRSTVCVSIELTETPRGDIPGNFQTKDPIGNIISGHCVIIATDYKNFAIKWGCNDPLGKICLDPYLIIKSRKKRPPPKTWKTIEAIISHFFEISLNEMIRVVHDNRACMRFPNIRRNKYPSTFERLRRIYKKK